MLGLPPIIIVIGSLNKDLITRTSRIPSAGETLIASSFETGSGGKGANQAVACARLGDRLGERRRRRLRRQQEQRQNQQGQRRSQQEQRQDRQEQRQDRQEHRNDEYLSDEDLSDEDLPDKDLSDEEQENVFIKMYGAVGDDVFGRDLIDDLASNGVYPWGVRKRKGQQTGVAVVLVDDESGENRILVSPNANYSVTLDDFEGFLKPAPDLIILQLEISLEIVCSLIKQAKAAGVPVLLNPAPAPAGGLPSEVYAGLTHLILNESEAQILSHALQNEGEKEKDEVAADNDGPQPEPEPEDLAKTAELFLTLGVENVVITLGARGAYYASSTQSQTQSHLSSQTPPAKITSSGLHPIPRDPSGLPLKVIDTTGAGDTFVGAYAVKICEGGRGGGTGGSEERGEGEGGEGGGTSNSNRSNNQTRENISEAVQWANLAASRSVLKNGAQDAMPWREEIDELWGGY